MLSYWKGYRVAGIVPNLAYYCKPRYSADHEVLLTASK